LILGLFEEGEEILVVSDGVGWLVSESEVLFIKGNLFIVLQLFVQVSILFNVDLALFADGSY